MPVFKVRGKTFVGIGKDQTTAVVCVDEGAAATAAQHDPQTFGAVRRQDATLSFLGVQVQLASADPDRVRRLIEQAWLNQAPRKLAGTWIDKQTGPPPTR